MRKAPSGPDEDHVAILSKAAGAFYTPAHQILFNFNLVAKLMDSNKPID
jgi:hypothetical protein